MGDVRLDPKVGILMELVNLGQTTGVKELLEKGVNVNECYKGNYPVILAASRNDSNTDQELVNAGADLWCTNNLGESALSWAERYQNEAMIKFLNEAALLAAKNQPKLR